MSKFIRAASIAALVAATSSAGAWYAPPYQATCMTPEQQQAMAAQQQAMAEQQAKAMEQAVKAQREFAEQQAAYFAQLPQAAPGVAPFTGNPFDPNMAASGMPPAPEFGHYPAIPDMPPMPEFGKYPAIPDMPPLPEFGQYPARPDMPAFPTMSRPGAPESMDARMKEMDAYRAQAKQQMQDRRAAMKDRSEQRRAMQSGYGYGPRHASGMHRSMLPNMECAPAAPQSAAPAATAQQQAAAPASQATTKE